MFHELKYECKSMFTTMSLSISIQSVLKDTKDGNLE